jgi:hypothetical protein
MNETTNRTTRECSIFDLNPGLSAAMRAHIAQYQLGDVESGMLMCCETTSTRQKKGMFGHAQTSLSGVFVTPKWLVWAEANEGKKADAGSAQLRQIDVHDYESTAMFAILPDLGFNITGRYTNVSKTGQTFIGLDAGQDGQKFRQVLRDAISKAPVR